MKTIVLLQALILLAGAAGALLAQAMPDAAQQAEISYLKTYIVNSPCRFTRNGEHYTGREAITHINRKQDYFREQIQTTEDFIRLAASKSETSGKNYTVSCSENKTENLGDWLMRALAGQRGQITP